MEELIDFNSWIENISIPATVYMAVYDPAGRVISVGPSTAFENEPRQLVIDAETAELIIEGTIKISDCFVDLQNNSLEITEVKSVFKIDDVLHRIVSTQYTDIKTPDVILTYDSCNSSLTIKLSDEFASTRKILWDGETVMNFLITDYNDPNILYNMLSFKISDLVAAAVTIDNLEVPSKFSVYTRRLFKNYVIEYK